MSSLIEFVIIVLSITTLVLIMGALFFGAYIIAEKMWNHLSD